MDYGYGVILAILFCGLGIIALFVACFVYRWHIRLQRKYRILRKTRQWKVFGPVSSVEAGADGRVSRVTFGRVTTFLRPPSVYYIDGSADRRSASSASEEPAGSDTNATVAVSDNPTGDADQQPDLVKGLGSVATAATGTEAARRRFRASVFVRRLSSDEEETAVENEAEAVEYYSPEPMEVTDGESKEAD